MFLSDWFQFKECCYKQNWEQKSYKDEPASEMTAQITINEGQSE
jgi:hypothetical protein